MNLYSKKSNYIPNPIDTDKSILQDDLLNLLELLAKNVHENWAYERINDGWKYGSERNDETKEHPGLVPYEELSDEEKDYDRITATQTLKVIISNGYKITKL